MNLFKKAFIKFMVFFDKPFMMFTSGVNKVIGNKLSLNYSMWMVIFILALMAQVFNIKVTSGHYDGLLIFATIFFILAFYPSKKADAMLVKGLKECEKNLVSLEENAEMPVLPDDPKKRDIAVKCMAKLPIRRTVMLSNSLLMFFRLIAVAGFILATILTVISKDPITSTIAITQLISIILAVYTPFLRYVTVKEAYQFAADSLEVAAKVVEQSMQRRAEEAINEATNESDENGDDQDSKQ